MRYRVLGGLTLSLDPLIMCLKPPHARPRGTYLERRAGRRMAGLERCGLYPGRVGAEGL